MIQFWARLVDRRARPAAIVLCGLGAVVLATSLDVLTAGVDRLPGRDSVNLYAWEVLTRSTLADGQLPYWNPFHFGGTPHLADPQTTVFYPPAMLLRWIAPAAFLSWMAALHVWLAGAGAVFLARVIGLGWSASAAVALAVMLGGSTGGWLHNGHLLVLYCVAWLPWALGLAILSVRQGRWVPHPALVVVLVLQFLAGYLQGSIYLVAAITLYYLFSAVWPEQPASGTARVRAFVQLGVLGVLALGVSAFQLLPTARLVAEAGRSSGIPYADAIDGAWSIRDLASFFFPFQSVPLEAPHRYLPDAVAYVGWVLTALVPLSFLDQPRRRITTFFAILAAAALAFVITDLQLYRLHYELLPGLRRPGRLLFLVTVSLAVLGGLGLERFLSLAAARPRRMLTGLAIGGAGVVAAAMVVLSEGGLSPRPAPLWPWLPLTTAAGLVTVGVLAARCRAQSAMTMALILVALDVVGFAAGATTTVSIPSSAAIRQWMGSPQPGRVLSTCENRIGPGEMLRIGQPSLDGMAGIYLGAYADWVYLAQSGNPPPFDGQFHGMDSENVLPARRDLIDLANVAILYSCRPLDVPSLTLVWSTDGGYVYRNESVRPRAFLACGGTMESRAAAASQLVRSRYDRDGRLWPEAYVNVRWASSVGDDTRLGLETQYGLANGVALDATTWRYVLQDPSAANVLALVQNAAVEDTHGVDRATGAMPGLGPTAPDGAAGEEMLVGTAPCQGTGTVTVLVQDRPDGRLLAEVDAPAPGFVFLSEPYYPERAAFVDGAPVDVVRANLAFSAVPVPAGSHALELRYVPRAFQLGLVVSVLTIVGWVGLVRLTRPPMPRPNTGGGPHP